MFLCVLITDQKHKYTEQKLLNHTHEIIVFNYTVLKAFQWTYGFCVQINYIICNFLAVTLNSSNIKQTDLLQFNSR